MASDAKGRGGTLHGSALPWALGALFMMVLGCSDGTRIVEVLDERPEQPPPEEPPSTVPAHIYLASADGADVTLLTAGERPAWSPDGRRIAFQRASEVPQRPQERVRKGKIHVIDADGSDEAHVGAGIEPAWSPDGERIAFEHRGDGDTRPAQIYVMNGDGTDPRRLTPTTGRQYAGDSRR